MMAFKASGIGAGRLKVRVKQNHYGQKRLAPVAKTKKLKH